MNVLLLYPIYSKIFEFLNDYEKLVYCITFNLQYKFSFLNGKLDCSDFKPKQFLDLILSQVNVHTLNWDACCRHRQFTKSEIVRYKKFVSFAQLKRFSKKDFCFINDQLHLIHARCVN